MTEPSLLITPNAVPLNPAILSSSAPPPHSPAVLTNGHITEEGDGEDYTIKCICSFTDDDGSTVMCEKCDTWQHVACYYQDGHAPGVDDSHYCVDCEPRALDRRTADDIQRRLRGSTPEETQRKPKKPGPKPKKKAKGDHLTQVNGHHINGHASPRNATDGFSKRPKARHQSSSSTTNIPLKLPSQPGRRSTSASHVQPSPMKSPSSPSISFDPDEAFSPEFMHLYDNEGSSRANVNEFDDLELTMTLGDWARDEAALAKATNGKTKNEVFTRTRQPIESEPFPLQIHTKVDKNITAHGKHPKWRFMTVEQDVDTGALVGELHGKIGQMQSYTQDSANRWEYLRHPVPFVFFHPLLPIIVDTREEGSVFRHLRRSCMPNLMMKTVLEEDFDYHFVFFATRDIEKGEELTIPWTLDEHTRRFFSEQKDPNVDDQYVKDYCRNVLAEFGGCACNETNCVMALWAGWSNEEPTRKPLKGRRKGGRGVSSRSGSEALKHYDDDNDDGTAASTSSHSKPHSRDITPSSTIDSKNILGEPISEREKRKIAALERSEQERHQPEKKKLKRKSADNRQNSNNPPPTPVFGKRASHQDMYHKDSDSPIYENGTKSGQRATASPLPGSAKASPPPPKPVYRENSCQTDLDATSPPRSMASPTRVLVRRPTNPLHRHVFRRSVLKSETTLSPKMSPVPEVKADIAASQLKIETAVDEKPSPKSKPDDIEMEDAPVVPPAQASVGPIVESQPPEPPGRTASQPADNSTGNEVVADVAPAKPEPMDTDMQTDERPVKPTMRIENMPPPAATAQRPQKSVETPTIVESPAPISDSASKSLGPPSLLQPEEKSPENKKKKMSLKEWSRRSSSNVPKPEGGANDGANELRSGLSPLKEDLSEKSPEPSALETPSLENGDPMVQ